MIQQEFETWFEEIKENAIENFGYSPTEILSFNPKNWIQYYEIGMTPFESILQHLSNKAKKSNIL